MPRQREPDVFGQPVPHVPERNAINRRSFLVAGVAAATTGALSTTVWAQQLAADEAAPQFRRIRTQFIAALAEPGAMSGSNAQQWGLWRQDPGPRGVRLSRYEQLKAAGGVAPAEWNFDSNDWWLEEHGLIMEQPEFPLSPGKYLVTGDRDVTTTLTVYPMDSDGSQRWDLADDATIYDVTHLRCRSARYVPATNGSFCSPAGAQESAFPVSPDSSMPPVEGCAKQDYAVLFVIGVVEQD